MLLKQSTVYMLTYLHFVSDMYHTVSLQVFDIYLKKSY